MSTGKVAILKVSPTLIINKLPSLLKMASLQSVLVAIGTLLFMQPALGDVILKPPNEARPPVALVLIPSAGVDPSQYKPLATAMQDVCNYPLWIGIPYIPLNAVLSTEIGEAISRILLSMQAQGMAVKTRLFFAAHSPVSANPLQDYLVKNTTLAHNTAGVCIWNVCIEWLVFPVCHSFTI